MGNIESCWHLRDSPKVVRAFMFFFVKENVPTLRFATPRYLNPLTTKEPVTRLWELNLTRQPYF
jgi:hypothetical protein